MGRHQIGPRVYPMEPSRCSACVKVKNEGRTIVNTGNTWGIAFGNTPNQPVFSVRMENVDLGFRVGYVLGDLEQKNATLHSLDRNGWFINSEGRLFSCNGDANRVYTNPIMVGDAVTVLHNRSSETISFEINGRACGVAFSQVKCHAGLLFPCVACSAAGVLRLCHLGRASRAWCKCHFVMRVTVMRFPIGRMTLSWVCIYDSW